MVYFVSPPSRMMKSQHTNNTFGNPSTQAIASVAKRVVSCRPPATINDYCVKWRAIINKIDMKPNNSYLFDSF
jgi:hypothetical protein